MAIITLISQAGVGEEPANIITSDFILANYSIGILKNNSQPNLTSFGALSFEFMW